MTCRSAPVARRQGGRLILQHGPIDIVAEAVGPGAAIESAYLAAATRFSTILEELCADLAVLRLKVDGTTPPSLSPAGTRMWAATAIYSPVCFITPMAAVAGAVADEICAAMSTVSGLSRIFVNNGGDAAMHLAPCAFIDIGIVARPDRPAIVAKARLGAADGVRGVATSGWRGRSFSLGIADAVTVFAHSGAAADAAATVIANAVDLPGHAAISRLPANTLQPDSDLGGIAVTVGVGPLHAGDADTALERGLAVARGLIRQGRIVAAALFLDGARRMAGQAAFLPGAQPAPGSARLEVAHA